MSAGAREGDGEMRTVTELMRLDGRRALVTGACGGLGRMIAETLAELGCGLVLTDLPGADFSSLEREIKQKWQGTVTSFPCNLEDEDQRRQLVDYTRQDKGKLDILVNNAGFVGTSELEGWVDSFEKQSTSTWRRALEVNITAAFELCRELGPLLAACGHGSIINIASIYGVCGPDYSLYEGTTMGNPAAYAASKGGLVQLTRWLATTLAPDVRVNAISPGGVFRNQPEEFVRRYTARTPLGRMASEEDFKGAVAYLASDLSAYVTGHNLMVDGGWIAW